MLSCAAKSLTSSIRCSRTSRVTSGMKPISRNVARVCAGGSPAQNMTPVSHVFNPDIDVYLPFRTATDRFLIRGSLKHVEGHLYSACGLPGRTFFRLSIGGDTFREITK